MRFRLPKVMFYCHMILISLQLPVGRGEGGGVGELFRKETVLGGCSSPEVFMGSSPPSLSYRIPHLQRGGCRGGFAPLVEGGRSPPFLTTNFPNTFGIAITNDETGFGGQVFWVEQKTKANM